MIFKSLKKVANHLARQANGKCQATFALKEAL